MGTVAMPVTEAILAAGVCTIAEPCPTFTMGVMPARTTEHRAKCKLF